MKRALAAASLIMKPEGYADGLLPSIKPLDGSGDFTFTRGSNLAATRVNSDGLIEKGRENLLLQSNQFEATAWSAHLTDNTPGQIGYDGSSDAWLVEYISNAQISGQNVSASGVQTISIYAKGSATNGIRIFAFGDDNVDFWFNLNTGLPDGFVGPKIKAYNIEDVNGDGEWYRCSFTFIQNTTSIYFYITDNNRTNATSGSIYIQDAQLEYGLVATDYIETGATTATAGVLENTPRIDYSSGAGALLLEPQRTNLANHSEYFEAFDWIDQAIDTTLELVSSGAPDGGAFYRCTSGALGGGRIVDVFTGSMSGGVFSLYAKGSGSLTIDLFITGGSNITETITLTSEWTRYDVYNPRVDSGGDASIRFYPNAVADIYGAQIESGTYPSSYIPTYGSSVTRVEDTFTRNNIYTNGLISASGGTWFVELNGNISYARDVSSTGLFIDTTNGGFSNGFTFRNAEGGGVAGRLTITKVISGSLYILYYTTTDTIKAAIKWNGTTADVFVNGTKVVSATSFTTTNMEYLNCRASDVPKVIQQMDLFPTALTDSECIALTTL